MDPEAIRRRVTETLSDGSVRTRTELAAALPEAEPAALDAALEDLTWRGELVLAPPDGYRTRGAESPPAAESAASPPPEAAERPPHWGAADDARAPAEPGPEPGAPRDATAPEATGGGDARAESPNAPAPPAGEAPPEPSAADIRAATETKLRDQALTLLSRGPRTMDQLVAALDGAEIDTRRAITALLRERAIKPAGPRRYATLDWVFESTKARAPRREATPPSAASTPRAVPAAGPGHDAVTRAAGLVEEALAGLETRSIGLAERAKLRVALRELRTIPAVPGNRPPARPATRTPARRRAGAGR
jgi:hypothetical protein